MIDRKQHYQEALDLLAQEPEHRESFLGGHFLSMYQQCPWKFFLKYILGFTKQDNQRYFIRGQAIHSGIEHFLQGTSEDVVKQIPLAYLDLHKDKYKEPADMETDRSLLKDGIEEWLSSNSGDRDMYEEIEHEQSHIIYLSNGFPLTVRLDRLVRSKETGRLYVIDTKTTKNNMTNILRSLRTGNQGISYMFAVHQLYDEWPAGVIADILLMKANKYSNRIESYRSPIMTYTSYAFIQWEMNILGILSEITQKARTYYNGSFPEEVLFPRNPSACSFLGCEYEDICRRKHNFDSLPEGYERDPWVDEHKVLDFIKDRSVLDKTLYNLVISEPSEPSEPKEEE